MRVIGSPDPYGKQIDGLGNGSSSTSKTVILSKSDMPDHDVNYLFGQVSINKPMIDWGGNCGNLTAAVGACAIHMGLIDADRIPDNGVCEVRIWQQNIKKTIIAYIPIQDGQVVETGNFELDGVTFPAAEVKVQFLDPVDSDSEMFPTGNLVDDFTLPPEFDSKTIEATFINAGIPTIFVRAEDLFTGIELQSDINGDGELLSKLEVRATGGVAMGLFDHVSDAEKSGHITKLAWVAKPQSYTASSGKVVEADDIDLVVRAMSMGQLHHAMMGTAAVAIAAAATTNDGQQGTLVNEAAGGGQLDSVTFGHPSGTLKVGGKTELINGNGKQKKWG